MGIRPCMKLIIGVANALDRMDCYTPPQESSSETTVNYWTDGDFDDAHYHSLNVPGYEFTWVDEIIYNPSGYDEYRCKGVVGMYRAKGEYDSNIFRAMAAIDERYMQAGFRIVPRRPKRELTDWYMRRTGFNEEDWRCHRFVDTVLESSPAIARQDWKRAIHYLKQAGWTFEEKDLRYILVWDWS